MHTATSSTAAATSSSSPATAHRPAFMCTRWMDGHITCTPLDVSADDNETDGSAISSPSPRTPRAFSQSPTMPRHYRHHTSSLPYDIVTTPCPHRQPLPPTIAVERAEAPLAIPVDVSRISSIANASAVPSLANESRE
ncbi:hypothetical protein BD779DRAFT_1668897 [Infundibulicybe gibba]|nr:hypothetical protein BD779DRAFT_1668897 [Infundibulicybe gibba]